MIRITDMIILKQEKQETDSSPEGDKKATSEGQEIVHSSLPARILGFEKPTENALYLAKVLAVLIPLFAGTFQLSTSFYMIHIAETLGGGSYDQGLTFVGILVVIQLAVQTALDYPTGVVGDWIGQRYVIASALFSYAIAFWLTATVTPDTPFSVFILIYALMGFGASQESGAFQAWFDNNYRVAMPHDEERESYGAFWGKIGSVNQIFATLVLIPGSWLAVLYARQLVFRLQAILAVLLALMVLKLIKDLPGVRAEDDEPPSFNEYTSIMKRGVRFLVSDPFVIFFILGEVLLFSVGPLWWNLLLFPLYFNYLLTEVAVSSYRTLIFVPNAVFQERTGIWAKRFEPKKWIPRFRLAQFNGFLALLGLAALTFFFPRAPAGAEMVNIVIPYLNLAIIQIPAVSIVPVFLMFIIFVVTGIFGGLASILSQRIMIDVIPNKIRNSLYSLRPTLVMILSMPLIAFFGWFKPAFGFPATFVLCAIVPLLGVFATKKALSHPIPKAELVKPASEDEREEVEELDVT
jgi:MFS family permease